MTLVKRDKMLARAPAVHAFVIGVGDYPALEGGSKHSKNDETWGLGQLTAAPRSALAFAAWLASELVLTAGADGPDRPLGSIELLVSQAGGKATFVDPTTQKATKVERASMANVRKAYARWFERASTNEASLLVFFFSGHGFTKERDCLLLDGFSGKKKNPFDDVIDFAGFVRAMNDCAPRQQCYLIDACRNTSDELRRRVGEFRGDPLGIPQDPPLTDAIRDSAIVRATSISATAHAIPGGMTRFTSALLRVLKGAGCTDLKKRWEVRTDNIIPHMQALLDYETRMRNLPPQNVRGPGDESGGFAIHVPPKPVVPVVIHCDPDTDTPNAKLRCAPRADAAAVQERGNAPGVWELELPIDNEYEFVASFANGLERKKVEITEPPLHEVKL